VGYPCGVQRKRWEYGHAKGVRNGCGNYPEGVQEALKALDEHLEGKRKCKSLKKYSLSNRLMMSTLKRQVELEEAHNEHLGISTYFSINNII